MKYIQFIKEFHENNEQEIEFVEKVLAPHLLKNKEEQTEIEHILDFLYNNKVKDVSRITYAHFVDKSKKWDKKLASIKIKDDSEGIETVLDFGDGFKFVKLVSKESYEKEGKLMSHCVASYYGKDAIIYSLRDSSNNPHCTIEDGNQIKGKGNGSISPKYVEYVVKFLESRGMEMRDNEMKNLGYVNANGIIEYIEGKPVVFRDKYILDSEDIKIKDGKDFFDIIKEKELVSNTETSIKCNFELSGFLKFGIDLYRKSFTEEDTGNSSQLASSGDSSQLASSGNSSKLASSGNSSQLASSGNSSKLASSGYSSQLASSGDSSQLASSGNSSQLASSGDSSKLASSGNSSKLASSGNSSQLASSGDSSKLASSGYSSQLASSGDSSKLASSGNSSQLASSGNSSQLASSGNSSQLASSGDSSKLASSGNSSQLASSGYYSQLEASGKNSIVAGIGIENKAKASLGSYIVLSEHKYNGEIYEIVTVKSVKVDGKKIKADTWYKLENKKFIETTV